MTARAWKPGGFALVPFGTAGADQVALVVQAPDRWIVVVRKWTSNKGRFLKPDGIPIELLRRASTRDERLRAANKALDDMRANILDRLGQRTFTKAQATAIGSSDIGICPLCFELAVPLLKGTGTPAAGFEKLHTC